MPDLAKEYWIIGASEGLGRALAHTLSDAGCALVLSARNADRLEELCAALPGPARALPLDLADDAAIDKAAAEMADVEGIVFAAGLYWPGPPGAMTPDQVSAMCDVNFTSAARLFAHLAPIFGARRFGHIVVIGSLSGFRGLSGGYGYTASKAGVMALAEGLHAELHASDVRVQLLNPGFIKTRLTDKNRFDMPFLMSAEQAADHSIRAMRSRRFQTNFPRVFSWLFRGSNFLPAPLYYRLFGRGKPLG